MNIPATLVIIFSCLAVIMSINIIRQNRRTRANRSTIRINSEAIRAVQCARQRAEKGES